MVRGYGEQPLALDILDVTFASLINATYVGRAIKTLQEVPQGEMPQAPMNVRIKWAALYILLAVALVALMTVQLPLLPADMK